MKRRVEERERKKWKESLTAHATIENDNTEMFELFRSFTFDWLFIQIVMMWAFHNSSSGPIKRPLCGLCGDEDELAFYWPKMIMICVMKKIFLNIFGLPIARVWKKSCNWNQRTLRRTRFLARKCVLWMRSKRKDEVLGKIFEFGGGSEAFLDSATDVDAWSWSLVESHQLALCIVAKDRITNSLHRRISVGGN